MQKIFPNRIPGSLRDGGKNLEEAKYWKTVNLLTFLQYKKNICSSLWNTQRTVVDVAKEFFSYWIKCKDGNKNIKWQPGTAIYDVSH
jgi:hypothetical protein